LSYNWANRLVIYSQSPLPEKAPVVVSAAEETFHQAFCPGYVRRKGTGHGIDNHQFNEAKLRVIQVWITVVFLNRQGNKMASM